MSYSSYIDTINKTLSSLDLEQVRELENQLIHSIEDNKNVFIFGNGGSAANAIHIANDLIYGITKRFGKGIKINALSANTAVITCLANDEGYDQIFVRQLAVLANSEDIVIALSGSGNSKNIVNAISWSNDNNLETFAILGYDGGKAKAITKFPIHTNINDMQISEDLQLIIAHMIMQNIYEYYDKKS